MTCSWLAKGKMYADVGPTQHTGSTAYNARGCQPPETTYSKLIGLVPAPISAAIAERSFIKTVQRLRSRRMGSGSFVWLHSRRRSRKRYQRSLLHPASAESHAPGPVTGATRTLHDTAKNWLQPDGGGIKAIGKL